MENEKKSLCFTCKFGLCVKQKDISHLIPNITADEDEPAEPWEDKGEQGGHTIKHDGTFAVCFWPVQILKQEIPVQVGLVEECNRYQEETSPKKEVAKPKK